MVLTARADASERGREANFTRSPGQTTCLVQRHWLCAPRVLCRGEGLVLTATMVFDVRRAL